MLSWSVQLSIHNCSLQAHLPVLSQHFTMATLSPDPLFDATLGLPLAGPVPDFGTLLFVLRKRRPIFLLGKGSIIIPSVIVYGQRLMNVDKLDYTNYVNKGTKIYFLDFKPDVKEHWDMLRLLLNYSAKASGFNLAFTGYPKNQAGNIKIM